jgi:4-diphosphocytidyl-2-C-methyl-D-erythritol kinase
MNSITLKSYGKINLFLHILGKRPDGFHELYTLFSKIGLFDTLKIEKAEKQEIICNKPDIPTDETNIINKVQKILEDDFGVTQKFRITLDKNIPDGGGLGGGSSNAASYLNGVCSLLGIDMDMQIRIDIMARVGSDTAFFLFDEPMIGEGRGEVLTPYGKLAECSVVLVNPTIHVSTAAVFSSENLKLTERAEVNRMRHASAYEDYAEILFNGLEEAVFAEYPAVKKAKDLILNSGADFAMMSGSGATVFGIFKDDQSAEKAIQKMKAEKPFWKYYKTYLVMR